jgi:hypothetical protein
MTRQFNDLGALAVEFAASAFRMERHLEAGLNRALTIIRQDAYGRIGDYQDSVGPFPAWAQLSPYTEDRKASMGYPADAPLLATGAMRASLDQEQHGLEGVAGFTDPKAVFHEFGTEKMPARPVMGPAAFSNREEIQRELGQAVVSGLMGGQVIAGLGYNFRI